MEKVLAPAGDDPKDIMERVSSVAAFLSHTLSGDHLRPEAEITFTAEEVTGLAYIVQSIESASRLACNIAPNINQER